MDGVLSVVGYWIKSSVDNGEVNNGVLDSSDVENIGQLGRSGGCFDDWCC